VGLTGKPTGRAGVLERAFDLLGCFTADEPILSAAEIAQRTGLAVSSVHRLLAKLLAAGYVEKVPPQRYSVGLKLWKVGELHPALLELRENALPHMLRLYEATGENIQLAVVDGWTPSTARALYIARVVSVSSAATLTRIGGAFPLHTTGVGKALLAAQDREWLAEYIRGGLVKETQFSLTNGADLIRDLEKARARGYATVREEMTLGTASLAVAFDRVAHLPAAAIGVVTEVSRFRERELGAMVLATAQKLHAVLREQFDR
jgi:DNA-binding IclR family transcriptional regulator